MRCIFWNIRGIANDKTQNRLSKLINKWDPDIVGIAEPMINPGDISSAYLQSLGMSASFYSNDRFNSVPNIRLLWKSTRSTPTLLHRVFSTNHGRGGGMSNSDEYMPNAYMLREDIRGMK
ncbi:hypothetical protein IFM89_006594 [Coptis chinensis]|uniref:Endonuclease/exonuclease/phosphatase domain-containing protein n=1 Tax=Coptis chinensis TaxID=261450 RepID=A0A835IMT8_9MAGN|nr:hypothetical protein IFM89_006594 [Coptis chinensis]